MSGLDKSILDNIDFNKSIDRILNDTKADFIFAPHIQIIYEYGSDDLIKLLKQKLRNQSFSCSLPVTIDVPKKSALSRPGSIMLPVDRLLYQVIVDQIAQEIEDDIDRNHVFSNVYDDSANMFEAHGKSYEKFRDYFHNGIKKYKYCLKMDVASYFESINQHSLINLLKSPKYEESIIRLLEKSLSSWSQTNSYSIMQGHFGSDILGNLYLINLDYLFETNDCDYCRFVDDIYVFSDDKIKLCRLLVEICNKLRKQGLFLNETKTKVMKSDEIFIQETEFDRMFDEINIMLDEVSSFSETIYGFQVKWDDELDDKDVTDLGDLRLELIEELYSKRDDAQWKRDDIIKYCYPLFARVQSDYPLDSIKTEIIKYPYLIKYYSSYLATIDRENYNIAEIIEELLMSDSLIYEYQYLWLFSSLLYRNKCDYKAIDFAFRQLKNKQNHETIRSICSILIAKFGSGAQLRALRDEYANESSIFVKSAILYGTRYFSKTEQNACKRAWGTHSEINELVIKSLLKLEKNKKST